MKYPKRTYRHARMPVGQQLLIVSLGLVIVFLPEPAARLRIDASQQSRVQTGSSTVQDVLPLTPGIPVTRELDRGQDHFYEFSLSAGVYMHAIVEQRGIDVSLTIFDRDKKVIAQVNRSNGSRGPEAISMVAPGGEAFSLLVQGGRTSALDASYQILMEKVRPPVAEDIKRIQVEKKTFEAEELYGKSIRARGKNKTNLINKSVNAYKEAQRGWHSLGERYEEALNLYSLGWCYSDLGSQDMVKFPLPLYRLRWSYKARGDHQTAISYFREALTIMRSLGNEHGQATSLAGLAWPNLYLGNEVEAVEDFSSALRLFESMGNLDGQGRALYGLGWAQAVLNKNEEALNNFSRALLLRQAAKDKPGEAINLASMGRIYGRLGNSQQALLFSERARILFEKELNDPHGVASTLTTKGWAYYALKQYREAVDSFQKALDHRDEHDMTGKAVALYGIAKVESQEGNLVEALNRMKRVIEVIDPLRTKGTDDELRTYYFANVQEYYSFYTELLMRLHRLHPKANYAETALWSNERARARELVAMLAEALADSGTGNDLESAKALTADDVRSLLDDDTILLEYSLTEGGAFLWAVTSTSTREPATQGFELTMGSSGITRSALNLIEMLREKGGTIQEFEAAASSLSKALIPEKVAARIRSKRKVVVVADGILQYLPFATMSLSRHPSVYTPLVVSHEVVTVPSMSTLHVLRRKIEQRPLAPNSIAVIADPVFKSNDTRVTHRLGNSRMVTTQTKMVTDVNNPQPSLDKDQFARMLITESRVAEPFLKLKRLVSTRDEAQVIRSLEPRARLELDFDASLQTVTAGGLDSYRIIHFATHGIALDNHPEASGIFLSMVNDQGESKDGYLYFPLVCGLNLPVELVVLSGCETNLGKDIRGEGLIGLTRGFMYAGVPRLVASLWEVRGHATKVLMERFYTSILRRGMRPSAALSDAQASMWKERKWTPSDWAAFSYSGEWR